MYGDLARLHGLGNFPDQIHVQQTVLQPGIDHLDVLVQLELALEVALGDSLIQELALAVAFLAPSDGQGALFAGDFDIVLAKSGDRHGDAIAVFLDQLHVVGRVARLAVGNGSIQQTRHTVETDCGTVKRRKIQCVSHDKLLKYPFNKAISFCGPHRASAKGYVGAETGISSPA